MPKSISAILAVFILIFASPAVVLGQARMTIRLAGDQDQDGDTDFQVENVVLATDLSYGYLDGNTVWSHSVMMSSDPNQLIHNPQVRKNLELDKQQIKELEEVRKEFQQRTQNELKAIQKAGNKFNQKKWNEVIQRITKERKAAMGAVLLPHQSKRLKQISTQIEMQNRGDANALVGNKLAEELGIDNEQKKRLKNRADEIKQEMEKQIAKIKEDGRRKLLRELKPDQREKLEEMMGEKFEFKKPQKRRQ